MSAENLKELLIDEMKDMLNAEGQLIKALPKMAKMATSDELRAGFEEHLEVTKQQKDRLEILLTELNGSARGKVCKGMQGILEENNEMAGELEEGDVMDALLIAGAQKVEHYEIASYGTMRTWAQQLGLGEAAEQLQQSLEEEEEADRKLSAVAETMVNAEAVDGDEEDEETETAKSEERQPVRASARNTGRAGKNGSQGRSRVPGRSRTTA